MQEDFLHYVWQHQYFDKTDLLTDDGQRITVLRPGHRNPDAGPDFLGARLQIGEVEWSGAWKSTCVLPTGTATSTRPTPNTTRWCCT
ncbi:DUF2851 family protein [Hymenobacter lapidiphilus]|nr:DUF2851 family protein [Hymenobacter sp. CCM 8763]